MAEDKITIHGEVKGPRWCGMHNALVKAAWGLGCSIEISEDRGWIRSTWYIKITGEREKVMQFRAAMIDAAERYNLA